MNEEMVVGVLGGMGTYATVNMFKKFADVFEAEKEWDRPRIIIDNRCTMPSRVLAFMEGKDKDLLITQMEESLTYLQNGGANRIILACNTSHLFLKDVYVINPTLESNIVSIIDACVKTVAAKKEIRSVNLLASEGTIESRVYQEAFDKLGIDCIAPLRQDYKTLRYCIEAVKQNKYSESVKEAFISLFNKEGVYILGCTELPILYDRYSESLEGVEVIDPLESALRKIHNEFINR